MSDELLQEYFPDDPLMWIDALPAFQKKSIRALLDSGLDFDAILVQWLASASSSTAPFSASPSKAPPDFLSNLKSETRAFICNKAKYKKEREELKATTKAFELSVVSAIAVAIAPHLGVAAAVITPPLAIFLASLGKVSLNAWCATEPG